MLLVIFLCFEHAASCRSQEEIHNMTNHNNNNNKNISKSKISYFGNSNTWGGWEAPENDTSWKNWTILFGSKNSSNFDSTEGSEAGWPQYWKGLGKANVGVPPPPWAYVPLGYGKPQFCFLQPAKGDCDKFLLRWGFNPTTNECQLFEYSGCGGNQNNFQRKESCKAACIDIPSTACETQSKINFEEIIYD